MNKKDNRKWIEMGKMFNKIKTLGKETYVYDLCTEQYDDIKSFYFENYLKIEKISQIEFNLTEEVYNNLCNMADEQDITVDEVVMNILKEYIEKENSKPKSMWALLQEGDVTQIGDEFYYPNYNEWIPKGALFAGEIVRKESYPIRRKINTP